MKADFAQLMANRILAKPQYDAELAESKLTLVLPINYTQKLLISRPLVKPSEPRPLLSLHLHAEHPRSRTPSVVNLVVKKCNLALALASKILSWSTNKPSRPRYYLISRNGTRKLELPSLLSFRKARPPGSFTPTSPSGAWKIQSLIMMTSRPS
uniref:Uncharacterized protein n=1 Tax=Hyaloperonospora arabidopsidis (strain Emoy2) TaxID=559515 RepID=M4BVY3_HYAAE